MCYTIILRYSLRLNGTYKSSIDCFKITLTSLSKSTADKCCHLLISSINGWSD